MTETEALEDRAVSPAAARELLVDLVSIPSPSGDECEAAHRLASFFDVHDREVWIDDVGNVRAPADDAVLLTSHVDTVPGDIPVRVATEGATAPDADAHDGADAPADADGGDVTDLDSDGTGGMTDDTSDGTSSPSEAKDDVDLHDDDAVLWGRGSVDATGPLAAMAVAAVETGASFVGVVGEETDSRGARHLVAERDAPDAVVNGEPSGWDALTLGYRGFLAGTYSVETEAGHSSRPEPNAVEHATAWVERAKAALDATTDEDSGVFESVTVKPVAIEGGVAADGKSVEATVDCQFRLPPGVDAADVRRTVADVTDVGAVEWGDAIPSHVASPRTELGRTFRTAIRRAGGDPSLLRKTGTADANLYDDAWDCPVATYGPGDSSLDHAPDERLRLAEFDRAIEVLESVATDLQ